MKRSPTRTTHTAHTRSQRRLCPFLWPDLEPPDSSPSDPIGPSVLLRSSAQAFFAFGASAALAAALAATAAAGVAAAFFPVGSSES